MTDEQYTREGFLQLLHERLAASHLAGREGFGFPVSSLKLLMHYFDKVSPPPALKEKDRA